MRMSTSPRNSANKKIGFLTTCLAATLFVLASASAGKAQDNWQNNDLPFAKPGPDAAMIVGAVGSRAKYIYPVDFTAIDGQSIHPREVMWLKPGEYELTVRAFVTDAPGLRRGVRSRSAEGNDRINVSVEPGKEYSIGAKYDPEEPARPYKTVVYQVEGN